MNIPIHPLTHAYVHKKHIELVKRMVKEKKLDLHHDMSEELFKAKNQMEFNAILDRYEKEIEDEANKI